MFGSGFTVYLTGLPVRYVNTAPMGLIMYQAYTASFFFNQKSVVGLGSRALTYPWLEAGREYVREYVRTYGRGAHAARRVNMVFTKHQYPSTMNGQMSVASQHVPLKYFSKVMFSGVCGFRMPVWTSYRTYRSPGYGYECHTELTEVLGTGMEVLQNSQKFFARYYPGKTPEYCSARTLQNTTLEFSSSRPPPPRARLDRDAWSIVK